MSPVKQEEIKKGVNNLDLYSSPQEELTKDVELKSADLLKCEPL
ncbi:unnamed protein product [Spirodela intermedia]|uniref:Uncharacterized protein n=2 Tax=Spirodela intermedia TaxID=51605 RepID=A0A7I8LFH0_SPIIN|nr:unnamed protein product [Spirodela intermedia]CAA6671645.1 unnamed protein product [Spirodela intermedia]CAA7408747.1 unnamed protein product [Spirodela intermedia]